MKLPMISAFSLLFASFSHADPVKNAGELLVAVAGSTPGSVVEIAEGTFELSSPLKIKPGTTLKGAGTGKTIITHSPGWKANPNTLPDPETNFRKFDKSGYLLILAENGERITVSDLTLTGPQVHGGIYGWRNRKLHLHNLRFENFMYCGFRSYQTEEARIHDCVFVDAGRRWQKGKPGLKGGITGGGIFVIWIKDSEIHNNRFLDTRAEKNLHYYGIKGRQGKRVRIHHNTIETNFSIEFAHENDEDVEIDHNVLLGCVSIPKQGGGSVPESGRTFHIHHNYFTTSYAIEFPQKRSGDQPQPVRLRCGKGRRQPDFRLWRRRLRGTREISQQPGIQSRARRHLDRKSLRRHADQEQPHRCPYHGGTQNGGPVRVFREIRFQHPCLP